VLVKSKYYPLILIAIFTLLFGLDLSFWVGLLVGYLHSFGLFAFADMSATTATRLESVLPFSLYASTLCKYSCTELKDFYKAGAGMGTEILPSFFSAPSQPPQPTQAPSTQPSSTVRRQCFNLAVQIVQRQGSEVRRRSITRQPRLPARKPEPARPIDAGD
jgi:hypothetical protein